MANLNGRIFARRGNRNQELPNTRLVALPTALTSLASSIKTFHQNWNCVIRTLLVVLFMLYMNSKDTYQLNYQRSLRSAFVGHCLNRLTPIFVKSKVSSNFLKILKTQFLLMELI